MKFVKTFRKTLNEATYASEEILSTEVFNRDFYLSHETPTQFTVNTYDSYKAGGPNGISKNVFQLLAVWYIRGTELSLTNYGETIILNNPKPRSEWAYEFVDSLPKYYITLNKTTTSECYAFGKELIAAVSNANKIPFDELEKTYNTIMEACLDLRIYATSPNKKTWLEAMSNKILKEDLKALEADNPVELIYSDEELSFYSKVFDINVPKWFVKNSMVKTDHGFAICPHLTLSDEVSKPQYDNQGERKSYDGNDNDVIIPLKLIKDSGPVPVCLEAERTKLTEQISFFLELPIEEQKLFMTSNYAYCDACESYYEIRLGCICGVNPGFDDDNEYHHHMATRMFELSAVV